MYFSIMIGSGIFFIMMSFTLFLPMIIVAPQKFAICFTLGCMFIMGAFFALKGPKSQALHMISKEVRLLLLISDMLLKHSSDLEMTLDWLSFCYWPCQLCTDGDAATSESTFIIVNFCNIISFLRELFGGILSRFGNWNVVMCTKFTPISTSLWTGHMQIRSYCRSLFIFLLKNGSIYYMGYIVIA